jgi:SAM-dependent methyltransferase
MLELGSYLQISPALHCLLGYQVTAASLGPAGTKVRKAASRHGAVILDCEVDLFDVERDTFPYPDGHFELVLACELLEHLRTDPIHMLFEIYRVLERDGRLLLTTPNCASIASLEQSLWRSANPYTYSLYPNPQNTSSDGAASHIREYTPDEVRNLLEAAGFRIEILITRPGGRSRVRISSRTYWQLTAFPPICGESRFTAWPGSSITLPVYGSPSSCTRSSRGDGAMR